MQELTSILNHSFSGKLCLLLMNFLNKEISSHLYFMGDNSLLNSMDLHCQEKEEDRKLISKIDEVKEEERKTENTWHGKEKLEEKKE